MSHRDKEDSRRENKDKFEWMYGFPRHWDETDVKYADGSIYSGHLTRDGKRTGCGTLRTPLLHGEHEVNLRNTSSIVNWMAYEGFWENNKPNGFGTIKKYSGTESVIVFQGAWVHGEPILKDP